MPVITLERVPNNIRDPKHWIEPEPLRQLIIDNPSLRGILYGYVAEMAFVKFLDNLKIGDHFKPDDNLKTKSDRTFVYMGREYTIQLKSMQTNTIREIARGKFSAKVQNDASERRLRSQKTKACGWLSPGNDMLSGRRVRHSRYKLSAIHREVAIRFQEEQRPETFDVSEVFSRDAKDPAGYPLTPDWTEDLLALLKDPDLGKPLAKK